MASTVWVPMPRNRKRSWLLSNNTVMDEPDIEITTSHRRVRLAKLPSVSAWRRDLDDFLDQAAQAYAQANGWTIWMSLGNYKNASVDPVEEESPFDRYQQRRYCPRDLKSFATHQIPYFMSRSTDSNTLCWRFRNAVAPIEAQIEASITAGYQTWTVETTMQYPGTWPGDAASVYVIDHDHGNKFTNVANNTLNYSAVATAADQWCTANPMDWAEGIHFGSQEFRTERDAVQAFAKIIRAIEDLEEISIPNLLDLKDDGSGSITHLSLKRYRTNFDQSFLDGLSDFLSGEPVIEQLKTKWSELSSLFRQIGLVVPDPVDQDWWRLMIEGADAAPVEITFMPVADEDSTTSMRHAVKVNLLTGTVAVACSKSATKDETAIQWESSKIKAELTGEKDRFLAYADAYTEGRLSESVNAVLANAQRTTDE